MKSVSRALALAGVVSMGAASASVLSRMQPDVTIALRQFHNDATFRDATTPAMHVENLLQNRIEFKAFKPSTFTPSAAGTRVLSSVLGRVHKQSGAIALSPDVVLYLVASAVADHVEESGEEYRHLFTSKASGKETIMIESSALRQGADTNDWSSVLPSFFKELSSRIQVSGLREVFEHNFSTSTEFDKACGAVVLMKATQNFVAPEVWSRGINLDEPAVATVKLRGTSLDWSSLGSKIATLSQNFPAMSDYFNQVEAIVAKCVQSFENPDIKFWEGMYTTGGNGWIRTLLDATSGEVTSVDFNWGLGNSMKFVCGVLSCATDEDGFLEPSLGYAVVGPF